MYAQAIVFTGKGRVQLVDEPVSEPGPLEVLLETSKTLISTGTEMLCLDRAFAPGTHWDRWVQYPFHPGYSLAGRVVAVGSAVEGIREGDRFAVREPHRQFALMPVGTLGRDLYPIPADVSDEDATWAGLATIVQNGVRRAQHTLGDTVVVIGLGLLGQLVVQYCRILGARQIIAVDLAEGRLAMARAHGATHTLAMGIGEASGDILALTEGVGADVVYDVTGAAAVFSAALPLLRRFGKLVLLGDTGTPAEQRLTGDVVTRGLTIVGAHDTNPPQLSSDHAWWSKKRMVDLFFTYLQRGDMRVAELVTHRFAPAEADAAYRLLRNERMTAMGVVFDWTTWPCDGKDTCL